MEAEWIDSGDVSAMEEAFHREHARVYDHSDPEAPIQVINLRMVVVGKPPKPAFSRLAAASGDPPKIGENEVYLDGTQRTASIYRRADLRAGHCFRGPAIVLQDACTTCVLDGFVTRVDAHGNMILEVEE